MEPKVHFEQMFDHLPDYRGVRGLVFLALFKAFATGAGPVGKEWICREINYSDKPVAQSLKWMEDKGIAISTGRINGWQLARAFQLPLMFPQLEDPNSSRNNSDSNLDDLAQNESNINSSRKVSDSNLEDLVLIEENTPKNGVKQQSSRKDSDSIEDLACLASSSSLTNLDSLDLNLATTKLDIESEKFRLAEIAEVLDEFGIQDPKKSEILAMPMIDAGFVSAHLENCEEPGQAIYRIQHRWDTKRYKNGPPVEEAAACTECGAVGKHLPDCRRRYVTGKYSEFIQH